MKSSFQTILVIIFAVVFGAAVLIFSGLINIGNRANDPNKPQGTVVMWGVVPQDKMDSYISNLNMVNSDYSVRYIYHEPGMLAQDITVALANGNPPDLILFSSDIFTQFSDKLYVIPYTAYTERLYRDTNIDGAQVFLTKDGVIGLPLTVDPVVVYYNKDLLAQSSFVVPPKTWSVMQQTVPVFTKKDERNSILQTAIALGTTQNINNVVDILSTLFMQTGNSIVAYDPNTSSYISTLAYSASQAALAQVVSFYTSFANPTNSNYSWNNALPSSLDQFLSGKSAYYIGRASELFAIQAQNPNLNFDVTQIFQTTENARPVTYGQFLAVGMLKASRNPVAAYAAMGSVASSSGIDLFSKLVSLPPVRRDLLLVQQSNPYISVFFNAALSSFAWPNPNPQKVQEIFRDMITAVTSGRSDASTAVYDAHVEMQSLLQ